MKETFRSDLNQETPNGMTNYEGWPIKADHGLNLDTKEIERQSRISLSISSDPVHLKRMFMHGAILFFTVAIVLIKACER